MDKKKEELLYDTYNKFLRIGLNEIPMKGIEDFIDEDIMGYGTTINEKILSISGYRDLILRQEEQGKDIEVKFDLTPVLRRIIADGNSAVFVDELNISMLINNENYIMFLRFTSVFEYREGKWIAVHWHGSKPEYEEGGTDTWHIDEQKAKTEKLEKQVAEKTAELESSLKELKTTQAQLIHSEKMASLGELTAGIAHEIKNPLNFINNFSEISTELLDEMQTELNSNGNRSDGVKEIVNNLKQNLEKINQHGKRADSIVKGMLLHSRGTSGEKTLTDINDLLEQDINLAYHGMRAQDKDFNITIEKDYDDSIGKINIIPQDISRVFLNTINNACYAAYDRKKKSGNDFNPVLKVSTKNLNGKVEIRIGDNGNGIPADIIDKIFQPFFTTKPTGEGTGLGLSLSYDIVTKVHGGELKVETKEGEYTSFIITLPNSDLF